MIVKNEADVIERCLQSAKPLIDSWTICDTGSTDRTRKIAKYVLGDLPGRIERHDWADFATNRNRALNASRGDWLLIIDADDTVEGDIPDLAGDVDAYMVTIRTGETIHQLPRLIRNDGRWRYIGPVHEYLEHDGPFRQEATASLKITHRADGGTREGRSDTYLQLLDQAVERDPTDSRSVFYLAQTLRETGQWERAIEMYRRRLRMGGWDEELFYSRYQLGCLLSTYVSFDEGADELLRAWRERPSRVEPLRALSNAANSLSDKKPMPPDALFVELGHYLGT
jgi:glycosyltransferase involved in cell wall biosynthesis